MGNYSSVNLVQFAAIRGISPKWLSRILIRYAQITVFVFVSPRKIITFKTCNLISKIIIVRNYFNSFNRDLLYFKFLLFEKKEVYEFSLSFFVQRYTDLSLSLSRYRSPFDATTPSTFDPSFQPPSINHHPHQKFPLPSPWKTLLPPSSSSLRRAPTTSSFPSLIHRSCILSSNAVADRNCESERRAGRRWADKTVVIKERSREIFPRQRSDIYTVLPASVKTRSLLAGARESRLPSAIAMRNATSRRGMLGPLDVRGWKGGKGGKEEEEEEGGKVWSGA